MRRVQHLFKVTFNLNELDITGAPHTAEHVVAADAMDAANKVTRCHGTDGTTVTFKSIDYVARIDIH